jgi:hypothetical protein
MIELFQLGKRQRKAFQVAFPAAEGSLQGVLRMDRADDSARR